MSSTRPGHQDRRFSRHFGIDFPAYSAPCRKTSANSVAGGSTITQQLARTCPIQQRTVEWVKETFLSLWLETNLSKKEILQLYLDRAYMGGGVRSRPLPISISGKNVRT
jgi:penicillin-binding protein 1A